MQRTENTRDGTAGCLQEWSQGFTKAIEGICSYLSIWVRRIQKLFSVADKKPKFLHGLTESVVVLLMIYLPVAVIFALPCPTDAVPITYLEEIFGFI